MYTFLWSGLLTVLLSACSVLEDEERQSRDRKKEKVALKDATLVWAGVDGTFSGSSSLYTLTTETLKTNRILEAESADPVVFNVAGDVLLFNRTADNLNFRFLTSLEKNEGERALLVSEQDTFPNQSVGDPHDVTQVKEDVLALANYSAGNVTITSLKTKKELFKLDGSDFRPEALYVHKKNDGETLLFVLHQGFDKQYALNGGERIGVYNIAGGVEKFPKSIEVKAEAGFGFFHEEGGKPLIMGLCHRYVPKKCFSGIEQLDPEALTTKEVFNFRKLYPKSDFYYNGVLAEGENANILYANVEEKTADGNYKQLVIRIDVEKQSLERIHTFPAPAAGEPAGGHWGMFFDRSQQLLLVGDKVDRLRGQFTVYKQKKKIEVLELDAIPYTGAFF